jgi:ferritin-like protein
VTEPLLHAADEEVAEKVFDEARQEIERHFELRQAFRLPEK